MDTRKVIQLDDDDDVSPPGGFERYEILVTMDEDFVGCYGVIARSEEEAKAIAIEQASESLDAKINDGDEEADYTIMDAWEWALERLFAEGFAPDYTLWERPEKLQRYVSIEEGRDSYWMDFSDTVEEAVAYFDQSEGDWTPIMVVDLDTDDRWEVATKAYIVEKEESSTPS